MALATACIYMQQSERIIAHGRRALEIGELLKSRTVTANALVFVGYGLVNSWKFAQGFEYLEKAWNMADEQGLTFVSFLAASMLAPMNGFYRRDPQTGKWWARRGLEKPGVAGAPLQRDMLLGFVGQFHVLVGELDDAREIRERGTQGHLASLEGAEGEFEAVETRMLQAIAAAKSRGDINSEYLEHSWLGRLWLARGEYGGAEQYLNAANLALMQGTRESWDIDAALALVYAETGRAEEGRRRVESCLAVLAEGEDWGGTAGRVALAEGAVAAAEGRVEEAEGHFERAIETFRRYTLPWDEAEALRCWGRALLRAGERERGLDKLDEAIAIYRRIGAGERWVELAVAERDSQRMGSG
jgi:tetratricopeptide (TPR) repeat protein